jgi:hypothetical protein
MIMWMSSSASSWAVAKRVTFHLNEYDLLHMMQLLCFAEQLRPRMEGVLAKRV